MFKKTLTAVTLSILSMSASADVILGGDVEVNAWMPTVSVDGSELDSVSNPAITAEASLEHVIPLIPNAKVGTTQLSDGDFDYSKSDAILYYEILDNDLVTFDIGVGATMLDIDSPTINDVSGTLPTAYAQGEFGIPATPLFVFAEGYLSGDGDSQIVDASVGVQYEFGLVVADLELQAGYKVQNIDLEDFDNATAEVEMDGFFVGVNLDF